MYIQKITKGTFCKIGKEGSSKQEPDFIRHLWESAYGNFDQVQHLAKRNSCEELVGIWGAMTDFSRRFMPWEKDFSEGLYLAGIACVDDALPPEGRVKWMVPGVEYMVANCEDNCGFREMLQHLSENRMPIAGAVYDYTDPATGEAYMFFR